MLIIICYIIQFYRVLFSFYGMYTQCFTCEPEVKRNAVIGTDKSTQYSLIFAGGGKNVKYLYFLRGDGKNIISVVCIYSANSTFIKKRTFSVKPNICVTEM